MVKIARIAEVYICLLARKLEKIQGCWSAISVLNPWLDGKPDFALESVRTEIQTTVTKVTWRNIRAVVGEN